MGRSVRRLAALAMLGWAIGLPGSVRAQGPREVVPNDPWFRNQLSFYFPGGHACEGVAITKVVTCINLEILC